MASVPSAPPEPRDRAGEAQRSPRLTQAPVQPIADDGWGASVWGTVGFAVATAVMAVERNALVDQGRGWWLWVGVTGTLLGIVGMVHLRRRRRRQAAQRQVEQSHDEQP